MSSKRFKYQDFLDKFENCPPNHFKEVNRNAFRWVFAECGEESFLPVLILNPKRIFETDALNCMAYSLSLFAEIEGAKKRYRQLVYKRPQLMDSLGVKIAEIEIDKSDGICSEPERNNCSHFSFHEYFKTDLSKKVINIAEIFDDYGNFKR